MPGSEGACLVRLTFDLLRPIPIGPLRIETASLRSGRRASWVQGSAWVGTTEVLRATAVLVRPTERELDLPPAKDPPSKPLIDPESLTSFQFPFFRWSVGYHTAVDLRIARGRWTFEPTAAWIRPLVPLVSEEATTPEQAVVIAADAANGVGYVLNPEQFTFINPDLSIHLSRPPTGSWVGLDTHTAADPMGIGSCKAELHDTRGPVGHSLQSLIIAPR
jgi:hypothetical protein